MLFLRSFVAMIYSFKDLAVKQQRARALRADGKDRNLHAGQFFEIGDIFFRLFGQLVPAGAFGGGAVPALELFVDRFASLQPADTGRYVGDPLAVDFVGNADLDDFNVRFSSNTSQPKNAPAIASMNITRDEKTADKEPSATDNNP